MRGSEGLLAVLFVFHTLGPTESTTAVEARTKIDAHGNGGVEVSRGSEGNAVPERPGQCRKSVVVRPLSLVQIKSTRQKTVLLEEEDSDQDAKGVDVVSQTGYVAGRPVLNLPVKPRVKSIEKVGLPPTHASHASQPRELAAAVNESLAVRASPPAVSVAVVPVSTTAAPAHATAAVPARATAAVPSPATASVTTPAKAAVTAPTAAAVRAEPAKHRGYSWSLAQLSLGLTGWAGRAGSALMILVAMMACAALIGVSLAQEEKATETSGSLLSADALSHLEPPSRSSPEVRPSGPKGSPPSMCSVQASRASLVPAAAQVKEDNFFCRDLVVPPNCECVLRVPISRLSQGSFEVTDMNKNVVLRVEPRSAPPDKGCKEPLEPAVDPQHLVLMTAFGNILAYCGPSAVRSALGPRLKGPSRSLSPEQKVNEFQLMKPSGEEFAKLTRDESADQKYVLSMRAGKCLHFWGDFKDYLINVTGDKNKLVARTEMLPPELPGASMQWYKVHVASLADAGLILCGLFCVQLLSP